MSEIKQFSRCLKEVLEIGIEHSQKHSKDLQRFRLEAKEEGITSVAEGLSEAAELAQALASKLRKVEEKLSEEENEPEKKVK